MAVQPSEAAAAWRVAVPRPLPAYDFAPPHNWSGAVPLGCRVAVPWRGEVLVGLVVGRSQEASHRLREVVSVLDAPEQTWVSPADVQALSDWAQKHSVPEGLVLGDLVAAGWEPSLSHQVRAVTGADLAAFAEQAAPALVPDHSWQEAAAFVPALLDAIREQGLLEEQLKLRAATQTVIRPRTPQPPAQNLTPKGQAAWEWLRQQGAAYSVAAWARGAAVSSSVASGVLARGWAAFEEIPAPPPALAPAAAAWTTDLPDSLPEAAQWRLTGGKVGARWAALAPRLSRVLAQGQSVLILAPDQATLAQAWAALSGLAQGLDTAALAFSGTLAPEQREWAWKQVQSGAVRLVIGSYLALALPLSAQLTVVLEDGSDAYKLQAGSRLWIPDMAALLAQVRGGELGYVSSVPSAETVGLPAAELPSPRVRLHTVDYSAPAAQPELGPLSSPHFKPGTQGYPLSHDLSQVLRQVQERGRQAALLAPRRGYSAVLRCPACEHTPGCPHCDVPLRFHQQKREMVCHQCGYHTGVPERCEVCGERMWQAKGPGTEWIAAEVRQLLGQSTPVWRFDRDHQDDLSGWQKGQSGVVVGTQLLLSQPAPPELALIGVTLADTWLNIPDFRAGERYHRLLWQLAGWHPHRAPLLVVQTFQPQHPALLAVARCEPTSSYPASEGEVRRSLGYPPYTRLAALEVVARDPEKARLQAETVAAALYAAGATVSEVLGPAPSPVARVRGAFPYRLLLRARHEQRLCDLLAALEKTRVRVRVDIAPRTSI